MRSQRTELASIVDPTREIVESIIWCTASPVDPGGSPRSRLMHPVWFWDDDTPVGLVTARRTPLKLRHLSAHPSMSCFYWDPSHHTVAIDALATWLDRDALAVAWESIASVPPPVGFDPAMIWPDGPTADDCGILRLDPCRIVTTVAAERPMIWSRRVAAVGG